MISVKRLMRLCIPVKNSQRVYCSSHAEAQSSSQQVHRKTKLKHGPNLEHFLANSSTHSQSEVEVPAHSVPYLGRDLLEGRQRKGEVFKLLQPVLRCMYFTNLIFHLYFLYPC